MCSGQVHPFGLSVEGANRWITSSRAGTSAGNHKHLLINPAVHAAGVPAVKQQEVLEHSLFRLHVLPVA